MESTTHVDRQDGVSCGARHHRPRRRHGGRSEGCRRPARRRPRARDHRPAGTHTNGRGLRSEDLLILEELGLRMPESRLPVQAKPVVKSPALELAPKPAAPVKEPAPKRAAPPTAGVSKSAVRRAANAAKVQGRSYRLSPPVDELREMYARLGGPAAVARHYGVPIHTVSGWLKRHRSAGVVFDAGEQSPPEQRWPGVPATPVPEATSKQPTTAMSESGCDDRWATAE